MKYSLYSNFLNLNLIALTLDLSLLFLFIILFIFDWLGLHRMGFALVAASGVYSPAAVVSFSLWWLPLSQSVGSRAPRLQ